MALLALLSASACSGDSPTNRATLGSAGEVKVDEPRATPTKDDGQRGGDTVQGFAVDGYRQLASTGGSANLVFSPYSVVEALAMTRAGARGETASQMDHVLHVDDPALLAPSMNGLDGWLSAANRPVKNDTGGSGEVSLLTANALWAQRGYPFEKPFLSTLATQYGSGVHTVDYGKDFEGARHQINGWVTGRTKDRIKELLGQGSLDALTRLVLTNAIYLKAPWNVPFADGATQKAAFHGVSGGEVQADFMELSSHLRYTRGDGWQAVTLNYAGRDLAMTVIVPDAGGLAAFEQRLDAAVLRQALGEGEDTEVNLKLPKFDLDTHTSLAALLKVLGMPLAFDDQRADFTGVARPNKTGEPPLHVADVIHQANITVDEKGTEASAATAVMERTSSAEGGPHPPVDLTVDRPFLFVVQHVTTHTPLFMGRVTDPTKK